MHALLPSRRANGRRRLAASGAIALAAALAVGGLAPALVGAVDLIPTSTDLLPSADSVQAHHPVSLTATVAPADASGDVAFEEVGVGPLGSVTVAGGQAAFDLPTTLAVGDHWFRATYAGDTTYAGSVSTDVKVTVTPDLVEYAGVGVSPTTFYPKVDGYRDTLKIKGDRLESLGVSVRIIRNSDNKLVRKVTIAAAAGTYSWSWNGRNASGTLQPAGRYTVRQTLGDGWSTRTVTSTVVLSWKKLDWRSFTATKTLRQAATGGQGWAGWSFTVPAATVYGKLTVSAYAKGYGAVGAREVACGGTAWNLDCYYGREFSGGWAWYGTSMPGKSFVSSAERVRVVVLNLGGKFGFEKVKVTLKYAVLR